MNFIWFGMNFSKRNCYLVVENTYVVWLNRANRFVQLKEPAFFVFEQWTEGADLKDIGQRCRERYNLPPKEAARFVREITSEIEKLYQQEKVTEKVEPKSKMEKRADNHFFSEHCCKIGGKNIIFRYGDEVMEEVFRPLFEQFEQTKVKAKDEVKICGETRINEKVKNENEVNVDVKKSIELFSRKGEWSICVNGKELQSFQEEDWEHFHGAVYTGLLSLLHGKKQEEWMGVFHAAALAYYRSPITDYPYLVTDRDEVTAQTRPDSGALLFVGESGSGKSTVAAILMAHGYRVLTDDFLPVGMPKEEEIRRLEGQNIRISEHPNFEIEIKSENNDAEGSLKTKDLRLKTSIIPLLYPLPAAISVKKNAIPILAKWFPELKEEVIFAAEEENYETYLPLSGNAGDLSPIPAKAIFFVIYDPSVDFSLTRESNLAMMNDFLKQSWIANNPGAARAFLNWYFSLPVYSLVYSDAEKLVSGLNLPEN